ncbi:hypothetical protein BC939DRAFT_452739 [Gamsiella multidivaricata]|uniref:uncharacterized protein n=1 Tax=Gamsiella multidivaricata TaxID=101098 RepID=UPI0022208A44|nr:uncharacterized protein BC939DRAFT_452739 [Gamsiella multidivaricata]KAI7822839.1 hypothetical protein BC939DRAFT_452739 [Gamsiella multidivaricata]
MSNPNPPFGDFLELDLMDTTTNDVFSFLFNNDDLNASFVVPSTVPSLDTPMDLSSFNPLSSPDASDAPTPTDICSATTSISTNTSIDTSIIRDTDINSIKKTQQDDIQMLLAMNRQLQEQLRLQQQQQHLLLQEQQRLQEKQLSQSSVTTDTVNAQTSVIDNSAIVAQLITANSLSAMPTTPVVAAVPVSAPKGPKTAAPEPSTTSIATAFAAADAQSKGDSLRPIVNYCITQFIFV